MLSRRTKSAIAAVLDVARLARGKPLPAKSLAARYDLAPRQFETVLQDLVRSGLLKGVRGPRGGYELARERRRISLGDIVRAIEAGRPDSSKTDPSDGTTIAGVLEPVIAEAAAAFMARLDEVSVEDVLRQVDCQDVLGGLAADADFHI
jgi:Rrf2 family iron-sulfur cluster assembly transcriptional regulator